MAAALGMGVVTGAIWLSTRSAPPAVAEPEISTLQRVIGSVRIIDAFDRVIDSRGHTGRRIRPGQGIEVTGQSRASLELLDGTSVRLTGGARITFESNTRLALERGIVYVDANPARRGDAITVVTPFATISHAGTQFELQLLPGSLRVRVREGEVAIATNHVRMTSSAGESLLVTRSGQTERSRIPTSGTDWEWVTTIAQPFTLEGATASAFLQWVSREQGWRCEYADAAARRLADRAVLHGSMEGLTPEEALSAVLPASGLTSRREGDRLIVGISR